MDQNEEQDDIGLLDDDAPPTGDTLETFRRQWRNELEEQKPINSARSSPVAGGIPVSKVPTSQEEERLERAKELFTNGVWAEQNGLIYEAMEYYRKATKIIPDIDLKMRDIYRQTQALQPVDGIDDSDGDPVEEIDDLCSHFQELCTDDARHCQPASSQQALHISQLPTEILTYIIRWVVSSDLDTRSLEDISMVCRGFYLLARDSQIWSNICSHIWGVSCRLQHPFTSWRQMCIERPHLHYNGVYMSKVEFLRQGEATLEQYYPPWQKVVYYRYLRFFPDGQMLMHTSSNDPATTVSQLESRSAKLEGMCKGIYRLSDSKLLCFLERVKRPEVRTRYRRRYIRQEEKPLRTTFEILFTLQNHGHRPNSLLSWDRYTAILYCPESGDENKSEFKLTKQDFPSCHFSRVKSYMKTSHEPLTAL